MEKRIDISLVFGKNEDYILPCIKSIYEQTKNDVNIVVVCNAKGSKLCDVIKREFPRVNLIENDKSLSFAANHNKVIKMTNAEYVLILNDDILIMKNAIDRLMDFMDSHKDVAAISPKLLNADMTLQQSTYSFPTLLTSSLGLLGIRRIIPFNSATYSIASAIFGRHNSRFWKHDKTVEVDTFRGACVLVRRSAIQQVGLMDEVCLMYGEETEWHYRMKKAGWKIVFNHEIEVVHYGGSTAKKMGAVVEVEMNKGILNFFQKHKKKSEYYAIKLLMLFKYSIKLITAYMFRDRDGIMASVGIIRFCVKRIV